MSLERNMYFYDEYCKEVLSLVQITSRILKYFIPEYQNCSIEDIIQFIYSQQTSRESKVALLNHEKSENKETIRYDLLFKSQFPDGRVAYIDIEAQNSDDRASIHRRSEIYAGYGFVSQKGVECHPPLYEGLKPFYQIWIGKRSNRKKSRVTRERMIEEDLITNELRKPPYSYQERVYISLGNEPSNHPGIQMFQILFSGDYRSEEVNDKLEEKFGFRLKDKEMEVLNRMCNFSKDIERKGRNIGKEETTLELIRNLMEEANIPIHKAMELLRVPMSDRERYTVLIQS